MEHSEVQKSKHPCAVCAKRKVKCDRLVPCTYCVKRGFEKECLKRTEEGKSGSTSDSIFTALRFWQNYEYWVTDFGLFKSQTLDSAGTFVDLKGGIDQCQYWYEFLGRDQSFQLLDYSMERLGSLYFGCLSDISDLYLLLEEYWQRREEIKEDNLTFTVDDHYSSALLWSIFSLAVYYMPLEILGKIFPTKPSRCITKDNSVEGGPWSEYSQCSLFRCFTNCVLIQLHEAGFLAHPDVRLIQIYLVLSATGDTQREVHLSNSLLLQCFHAARLHHVDEFRPLISDSTALRLSKITCEKIWYSLCSCDYLQSSPKKPIEFHTEISSLLQHAAYLEDLPNTDVYQSEDSFEVLYWKIISLDRDLNQYSIKGTRPPLKTLDAIQRQIDIFSYKISSSEDSPSLASDFARFLASFLLDTISWKLNKMYFIYFGIADGLTKSIHYAKSLIALLVKNIKSRKDIIFNKHPIIMWSFAKIATFYAFYEIISNSAEIQNLNFDIREVLQNLSVFLEPHLSVLDYLLSRFQSLKSLWKRVEPSSPDRFLKHPVMTILQDDVDFFSQQALERPSMIRGSPRIIIKRSPPRQGGDDFSDDEDLRPLIVDFESQYPIECLTRRNINSDGF